VNNETVHPMVMKAAQSWFASEMGVTAADDPEEWAAQSAVQIRRAQAALTECGALECLEALESARGYVAQVVSVDGEEVSEIDNIIAKVYGSAPGRSLCGWIESIRELLDNAEAELDRLRAECESLTECLRECADDLEAEVKARGDLPRRVERDLEPTRRARELLTARAARQPFELRHDGVIKLNESALFASEMFGRQVKASRELGKLIRKKATPPKVLEEKQG
jgi:hypothetical protein